MADPFDAQGLESQITAALGQMPDPAEQRRNAMNVALVQALQNMQQAGTQRHQSAFGSIAGALGPLAMIPTLQGQAVQDQQLQVLKTKVALFDALVGLRKAEKGDQKQPTSLEALAAQKLGPGASLEDIAKQKQAMAAPAKPPASFPAAILEAFKAGDMNKVKELQTLAGESQKKSDNTLSLIDTVMHGSPEQRADAQEKLKLLAAQKQAEAGATAAGRAAGTPKKPATKAQIDEINSQIGSVDALDRTIAGMAQTNQGDIVKSWITGGALSNQTLRDYQKFKNDLDQARYGARGATKAALDRINQETPSLQLALQNPAEFMRQLRQARSTAYEMMNRTVRATGKSYALEDSLTEKVASLAPKMPIPPEAQPTAEATSAGADLQKMLKSGISKEQAIQELKRRYGEQSVDIQ